MKIIIAILLTIIAVMALLVGATIVLDSRGDLEEATSIEDENGDTDTAITVSPIRDRGADYISIAVSFAEENQTHGRYLTADTELLEEETIYDVIVGGDANFAISFNDLSNTPFTYSSPIPYHVLNGEAYSVATFVFSLDGANGAFPSITFFPRYMNSAQHESAHTYATFFVSFDGTRDNENPLLFTVPMPDNALNLDTFAVTFIISLEDSYFSTNQLMADTLISVGSENETRTQRYTGGSSGGSISVQDAENIKASLVDTWVYRAAGVHVEMTFMNDWRYYEIQYAPSGRPLSWESGVYSIECGRTITIQSGSIWGPTYIYNFRIRNNGLTLTYNGVNYVYTRQNRLPILSLENFPYTNTSGYFSYPYEELNG